MQGACNVVAILVIVSSTVTDVQDSVAADRTDQVLNGSDSIVAVQTDGDVAAVNDALCSADGHGTGQVILTCGGGEVCQIFPRLPPVFFGVGMLGRIDSCCVGLVLSCQHLSRQH